MTTKLNQILATEKSIKTAAYNEINKLDKANQKRDLYEGFVKTYKPLDDDGQHEPTQMKKVQMKAKEVITGALKQFTKKIDVTATKDFTNCEATANVVVGDQTILENAPVTFLLFLEKELRDLRTFCDRIPTLDPSENWTFDDEQGLYKTVPSNTHRTQKKQRPITLAEPTVEHPAQAQLITEDIVIGTWTNTRMSGAMRVPEQQEIIDRIDEVLNAVKYAREQANTTTVQKKEIAEAVFGFIFKK